MSFYINDKEYGLFIGELLGLAIFEGHVSNNTNIENLNPIPFDTIEDAQSYLNSWSGGIQPSIEIIERD